MLRMVARSANEYVGGAEPTGEYCAFDAAPSLGENLGHLRTREVKPHLIEYAALILLVTAVSWISIPHFLTFNYNAKLRDGKDQLKHLYLLTAQYRNMNQEWPAAREGLESATWSELGWEQPRGRRLYRLSTDGNGGAMAVGSGADPSLNGVKLRYTDPDPDGFESIMYIIVEGGQESRGPFIEGAK